MSLNTFETQVKAEYGKITAQIALHPKTAVIVAFLVGGVLGHFL